MRLIAMAEPERINGGERGVMAADAFLRAQLVIDRASHSMGIRYGGLAHFRDVRRRIRDSAHTTITTLRFLEGTKRRKDRA